MTAAGVRGRRARVTDEPLRIAPRLMDHPLASVRRRFAALAVDLLLFAGTMMLLFTGASLISFHREDPTLLHDTRAAMAGQGDSRAVLGRFLRIALNRSPDFLEPDMKAAVEAGDWETLQREVGGDSTSLTYAARKDSRFVRDGDQRRLEIGNDILLGPFSTVFSWGAFFVGWFTLAFWIGNGRTAGKRLFGLRVARLDGRRLTLWDSFGRAGSYTASGATLLLGFLEAAWHPNRQALHDKVSGTVVLRGEPPAAAEDAS
ncbi:MAG TPA: RDD family protein [Candidatus Krumholzibacteria bacterium]|nr:RDD family protein [Candidatus Krumholzibacteria bacterium]